MLFSPQVLLGFVAIGLLFFLVKGRAFKVLGIDPAASTISAAKRWIGRDEQDPRVVRLVDDYVKAWDWAVPPKPGELPDWCVIALMEWIREGLELPPWPITKYRAPLSGFPWRFWLGDVGDVISIGLESPAVQEVNYPKPGDVYTQGTSHAGLVVEVDGDRFTTVDANWSNAVGSRRTHMSGKRFWRWS